MYDYEASFKAKKNIYKKEVVKSDARAFANEFGTAKMPAKPFLRPALETSSAQLLESLATSLRNLLIKNMSYALEVLRLVLIHLK